MVTTGTSRRTVSYVRKQMMKEGLLPKGRRVTNLPKIPESVKEILPSETSPTISGLLIDGEKLRELAKSENFEDEIADDEDTQKKLLKEIRKIALGVGMHPDTRLSAIQVWAKLKDIAKSKEIGPGNPKTEEEVILRLVRLMQAVGPKLVIKALEAAFERKDTAEEAKIEQTPAFIRTTKTSNPPDYEGNPSET